MALAIVPLSADTLPALRRFAEKVWQRPRSEDYYRWRYVEPAFHRVWLAMKDGKLAIMKTPNGENPLVHGATPILGVDVWEHSYYIDYRNRRPDYLKAFIENLVNWEYVERMYDQAAR